MNQTNINKNKPKDINLVADIGGTNIRLATCNKDNSIEQMKTYQCAEFASLLDVIKLYITESSLTDASINACLAIACPVDTDLISMTNLPWKFSQQELQKQLGLKSLTLINDYTAIAMAIPLLNDQQKVKIGQGEAIPNKPIAVCGPGTGLGVANLISVNGQWHCLSGEGGHVDFAPVDELDILILQYLKTLKKRVSYEQLLSGYGLEQIYQALNFINHQSETINKLSAKDICAQALNGSCIISEQALNQFCKMLGSFAGNLALTMDSLGGVYIAGGIVPRFVEFCKNSDFRARFETKGRMSHLNKKTPTYIITESQPGLLGATAYINQIFD